MEVVGEGRSREPTSLMYIEYRSDRATTQIAAFHLTMDGQLRAEVGYRKQDGASSNPANLSVLLTRFLFLFMDAQLDDIDLGPGRASLHPFKSILGCRSCYD